jgi:hypothetical protein
MTKPVVLLIVSLLILSSLGCDALTEATGLESPFFEFEPVWLTASWTGGARPDPNDRKTLGSPTQWRGNLCPSQGLRLFNHRDGAVLTLQNTCPGLVTFYLCATKGVEPQPRFGLQECAQDAKQTPMSRLKSIALNPGVDFVNSTRSLSIQVFWCTDQSSLIGPPLSNPPLRCLAAN